MEVNQGTNVFGPKTLNSGWFYPRESWPKDNDPAKTGNYNISTYRRLGTFNTVMISEARDSQQTVYKIKHYVEQYSPSNKVKRRQQNKVCECGLTTIGDNRLKTEYISVMKNDYPLYDAIKEKPFNYEEMFNPETKFRRLLVDGASPRRPGRNKFYDENMDYLNVKKKQRDPYPYALME